MSVPIWQPGYQYLPGDIVRPTSSGDVEIDELDNADFEAGLSGWTLSGSGSIDIDDDLEAFGGNFALQLGVTSNPNGGSNTARNNARLPVVPGQIVTLRCFVKSGPTAAEDTSRFNLLIRWFNASLVALTAEALPLDPTPVGGVVTVDAAGVTGLACVDWRPLEVVGIAPAGAAYWTAECVAAYGDSAFFADDVTFLYANQEQANPYNFRAVQAAAGFSGETEPDWPTTLGNTVIDNEVTWEAIAANFIVWEAQRILVSDDTEPTWPTDVNGSVIDNTIAWVLDPLRVQDSKVPQSSIVLKAGDKVWAGDDDIVRYSATVNPLDWSTTEDAGFVGFGLQQYGGNPVTALGLYRGNVAAFNSEGCQIWQADPDPAAITLLDAVPVPCTFPKSVAPVADDLFLLTDVGIRGLAYAGAAVNLQAGYYGAPVDPIAARFIQDAEDEAIEPLGLYWPAQGQYWLIVGDEALVMTISGSGTKGRSWSRYTFPSNIDAWTLLGVDLYLRSGDYIWRVDPTIALDDYVAFTDTGVDFTMVLQWPHLDLNRPGPDKTMKAFDLIVRGVVEISIGWDQASNEQEYDVSGAWTTPFEVDGDTLPKKPIPLEVTAPSLALRLEFNANQVNAEWLGSNLYIDDNVE